VNGLYWWSQKFALDYELAGLPAAKGRDEEEAEGPPGHVRRPRGLNLIPVDAAAVRGRADQVREMRKGAG